MAADRVRRFDSIELRLDKAERLANGWLRADAVIGRVGVLPYQDGTGKVHFELRDAAEVFSPASMGSFHGVPITNDHPPVALDATNAKQYAVGSIVERPRRDGDHLVAKVMITDAATIEAALAGRNELSPGYTVEIDPTPGIYKGQRYDARQTNILGNHVARVDAGRQGPSVSLRLDSGDAVAVETPKMDEVKITLDGTEYTVPKAVADAIQREDARMKKVKIGDEEYDADPKVASALAAANKKIAKLEAKVSGSRKDEGDGDDKVAALEAKCDSLAEQLEEQKTAFDARVGQRVRLVTDAQRICGAEWKADKDDGEPKSDAEIMREIVLKVRPNARLDGRSEGYLEGAYEDACDRFDEQAKSSDRLLEVVKNRQPKTDEAPVGPEAARLKMIAEQRSAWQTAAK